MRLITKSWWSAVVLTVAILLAGTSMAATKNVFMMISDGASFGAWDMTDLYTKGSTTSSSYFGPEFKKYLMTTFPLNTSTTPTGGHVQEIGYNPASAWDTTSDPGSSGGYPYYFKGYHYVRENYTDSAAAGTALATGVKTYNNAINWDNDPAGVGKPIMPTIPELAKQHGKAVGTISSVPWSHATPASFSNAHNISRNNYMAIANNMLNGNVMDVIMGAGHPQYNNDGIKVIANYGDVTDSQAKYVGGRTTWIQLNEGTHLQGWTLIQNKGDFEAIANGTYGPLPARMVGTAQVATTLQQSRSGYAPTDPVDDDPPNTNVPSLLTMTRAAVNLLYAKSQASGDKGFFLQIEGGAVDWAAHGNQTSRLIEEQRDFNRSVDWVIGWIESHGGWSENLLIVTTDHGNSLPMGKNSDLIPFDRIELADVISTPKVKWYSNEHTNELVPLFVRGAGADLFDSLVDGVDSYFGLYYWDWAIKGFDGRYIDNTDVALVLKSAVVPVPASFYLFTLGLGCLGLWRRRSRA